MPTTTAVFANAMSSNDDLTTEREDCRSTPEITSLINLGMQDCRLCNRVA